MGGANLAPPCVPLDLACAMPSLPKAPGGGLAGRGGAPESDGVVKARVAAGARPSGWQPEPGPGPGGTAATANLESVSDTASFVFALAPPPPVGS